MTHLRVSEDDSYVAGDIAALLAAMGGSSPGRESELMRLLLARVTLDNGFQFQGLCDLEGNLWEANHTALAGAGLVRSDIHGRPFWQARWWQSSEPAQRQLEAGIRRAARGEFVRHDAVVYGGDRGAQTIVIDFSIRPVLDGGGRPRFLVVEGRDVTEQRRLERAVEEQRRQLAEAVKRLEEADQLKSQMFANVSHELRTPLTLILGPTQRLRSRLGQEHQHDLHLVESNARLVLEHVTDLLDAAKLEAGAMSVRYSRGDLGTWLREWVGLFGGAADHRRLTLGIDGGDVEMEVDVEHLRRILTNLLGNAVKFTPVAGAVRVAYRGEGDRVVITVDDSGPGIAPEDREAAFDRFRQLDGGAARRAGGTGLGLAISRQLVSLLQGTISIDTSPLGGTRVTVALPARSPAGTLVGVAVPGGSGPASARRLDAGTVGLAEEQDIVECHEHPEGGTVLVCEDDPQLRVFLVDVLGERYDVVAVANGALALGYLRKSPPDLLVTDIMMPVMSGDQLIAEIQGDPDLPTPAVLVLSARADEDLRERLLEHGARDYLNKPFGRRELLARVENLMAVHRHAESLEERVRERTAQLSEAQERIALELNDTVVRRIFSVSLALEAAAQLAGEPALQERLQAAIGEIDTTIRQVRTAVFDLQTRKV